MKLEITHKLKATGLEPQGYSSGYLINRYLAYSEAYLFNKGNPVLERKGYEIQWINIKNDCFGLLKNPSKFIPQIAYSLAAFYFIFKGEHSLAKMLAFGGSLAIDGSQEGNQTSGATLTFTSHTVAGNNRVMGIGTLTAVDAAINVSFNNAGAIFVVGNETQMPCTLNRVINPDLGAHTVSTTFKGATGTSDMRGYEIVFTGANNNQNASHTNNTASASASSLSFSVTTTSGNYLIGVSAHNNNNAETKGEGTDITNGAIGDQPFKCSGHYIQSSGVSQTYSVSWTTAAACEMSAMEVLASAYSLSGTVTLSGVGVPATVRVMSVTSNVCIGAVTCAADGTYSMPCPTNVTGDYHVVAEYTNAGQKYNALSDWAITPA